MKTHIYYYTGTGNSLWTARRLAAELGDAAIFPMAGSLRPAQGDKPEAVGLVFPVHMWGVPGRVLEFVNSMEKQDGTYYFAAAVNGSQVSRTLIQLREVMAKKGMKLSAGLDVVMPSNYVPWGGPGTDEEIKKLFAGAEEKIKRDSAFLRNREARPVDMGPLWQRIVFTWAYNMSSKYVPMMDRDFWVDEKCNSCGICAKVCPAKNIELVAGKPTWKHKCQQCLACIQWCPEKAIQYGKKTPQYPRYHHPEVKLADIIESVK